MINPNNNVDNNPTNDFKDKLIELIKKNNYKLTRYGKLKCIGYNCYNNSESDLLGAKFKCEYHEREKGSYQAFCNAVQIATQINFGDSQEEADNFFEDLVDSLARQRKQYKI